MKRDRSLWMTRTVAAAAACVMALPLFADSGPNHQVVQTPPVQMGTSGGSANDISRAFCCGGTLGSLLHWDAGFAILSNNHVLARGGAASPGEVTLQPGLIDTSCQDANNNTVGDFPGDLVPLGTANVDVAISIARSNVDTTGAIIDVGVPCTELQAAAPGLAVAKSGRTTGFTTGTVQATNASVKVQYQKGCGQGRKFTITYSNQVTVTPGTFSAAGDSGSLIVSDDGTPNPTALLFAGSSSIVIGNPIQDVMAALAGTGHSVSFAGNSCGPVAASLLGSASTLAPSDAEVEAARGIKERHEAALMARPDVLGIGVGADDADPTRAAIILYVEAAGNARPHGLPADLDGVKVRVIPTDTIVAQ